MYKVIIFILSIVTTCIGFFIVFTEFNTYRKSLNSNNSLLEYIVVEDVSSKPELVSDFGNAHVKLEIDIDALVNVNSDYVGWLYIPNSPINVPIVQTTDNEFYLENSFYKKKDKYGAIFIDSSVDLSNENSTILIHGHNNVKDIMFGYLDTLISDVPDDLVYVSMLHEGSRLVGYRIVASAIISEQSELYQNVDEFDYINLFTESTVYSAIDVNCNRNIVLSTCYGNSGTDKRLVILLQPNVIK